MKLGVIARAEDRGLGIQTWEVVRHMNPERVLVVRVPGSEAQGFELHRDRFPGATVLRVDERNWTLPEQEVREWLSGLDVVYTAETVYDQRLIGWANEQHVATVIQANPEFHDPSNPPPTVTWVATEWRIGHIPGARIVPMPVALDRFPEPDYSIQPARAIHTAGRRATGDRNGTETVLWSQNWAPDLTIDILEQTDRPYWENYQDASVFLMPRRYGGLCLPANEACAAGLVPVMTDISPNRYWPIVPVHHRPNGLVHLFCGEVPTILPDPEHIALTVRQLLDDDLTPMRKTARQWAEEHSWTSLRSLWESELEHALLCLGAADASTGNGRAPR